MADFYLFDQFSTDIAHGVHRLDSDILKVYLTNQAPSLADKLRSDIPELAAGNGYGPSGGKPIVKVSSAGTGGVYAYTQADDVEWTASGGPFGPLRYAILYNSTAGAAVNPLIGYWDYGVELVVPEPSTFKVNLQVNVLQIQ